MKGSTKKRILAIVTAVLLAAVAILPGVGTLTAKATSNYTPVVGTSTAFTKYLVIPADTPQVPALKFAYTIAPGAAVNGDPTHMSIYAGNDAGRVTGAPTIAADQAEFGAADTTTAGAADDGITNDATKKYAFKTVTIDFTGVTFSEPGVYRYLVTEDNTTPANVSFDQQLIRTLDVNVVDVGGALSISAYTMYYGTVADAQSKTDARTKDHDNKKSYTTGIAVGDKCDNYVNSWPAQNIYFGKKISGNQASKDKYFRFTITLENAGANTHIGVIGEHTKTAIAKNVNGATKFVDDDLTGDPKTFTNPTSITTGDDEKATAVFYLQGGQYVCLQGIPENATYTIAEDSYVTDGYVTTATDDTDTDTHFTIDTLTGTLTFDDDVSGTVGTDDIYAGFTNTKDGMIPTGVIVSIAPWVIAGVLLIGGIVFFAVRSRRKMEEE